MKHLTITFLLSFFLVISLMSQANFNVLGNNQLEWVKVYETDLNIDQVKQQLKRSGNFIMDSETENEIHFLVDQSKIDYKGAGFKMLGVPAYLSQNDFRAFAVVQFKEGKYRVILKNIVLIRKKNEVTFTGSTLYEKGDETELEKMALKKSGKYSNSFIKPGSTILNYTFNELFTVKNAIKDW